MTFDHLGTMIRAKSYSEHETGCSLSLKAGRGGYSGLGSLLSYEPQRKILLFELDVSTTYLEQRSFNNNDPPQRCFPLINRLLF